MTEPEFARADAVAGLASEVERLRRAVDELRHVPGRLDDVGKVVNRLADTVAALTARPAGTPAPSWLLLPADEAIAAGVLGELCGWLQAVYLRYPDAAQTLPECWCWHAEVVEELIWLMHAWGAAYQGKAASVALAGDWHDRQRPGVVKRIRAAAGSCSREAHMTRAGREPVPSGAPALPGVEAADVIATWWGSHRDDAAPEPGELTRRSFR